MPGGPARSIPKRADPEGPGVFRVLEEPQRLDELALGRLLPADVVETHLGPAGAPAVGEELLRPPPSFTFDGVPEEEKDPAEEEKRRHVDAPQDQ